ncbi:peptidoglycan D,D-transpeptidase FtsI family protein [Desulfosarcina ovata]|uniref:Penicillin-binding protein n=1 Tax=Desulfosarcina ovata subsp. ovata TaxID=2752305 RepID=A0A5K8AG88_9BACT|nr:penicillin-binding protein 2 [Desulfosarcina ovata]BBO91631.1 penicillin-binding protein [Desulfosarcina ovata subsp. ovata]
MTQPPINTRMRLRTGIVGAFFMLALAVITAQAVRLNVFQGAWLSERAAREYERAMVVQGKRGAITDRNGTPLAVSIDSASIAAYPRQIENRQAAARQLARALGQSRQEVAKRLDPKRGFVWIKRQAVPRQAEAVRALGLKGIDFISEHSRYYPNKTLAAQLVGFSGIDSRGLEGLEFYFDGDLKGREEEMTIFRDALGRRFEGVGLPDQLTEGNNVVLTIDSTIQHIAQKALETSVTTYKAESGMAVVMAPATGEVLALAHYPFFNPNRYGEYCRSSWRNRAVTDSFEPGSTMKMFSAAAAIDSGVCSPSTIFYCENGEYRVGRNTVHDTKPHGWLSLQQIVKYSSNIGSVKMAEKLGPQQLYNYLYAFGFGQRSGIACPGETAGSLSPFRSWSAIDTGAISFGQGVSVSVIQLATAASAIANGGMLMKPQLVRSVTDRNGRTIKRYSPEPVRQVISTHTAAEMRRILKTAISEGGTGVNAAIQGYSVCGKTGTAQKIDSSGTYAKGRYLSSFIGFAPADQPELTILVIVDEPTVQCYGGIVAAPAFRQIALETLGYLNIPPGRDADQLQVSRGDRLKG